MTKVMALEDIFTAVGSQRLSEITDLFIWRMQGDRQIEQYIPERAGELTLHMFGWLLVRFGGPTIYDGRDLSEAGHNLRNAFIEPVTPAIYYMMGSCLISTALAAKVPRAVADAIAVRWMDLMPDLVLSTA